MTFAKMFLQGAAWTLVATHLMLARPAQAMTPEGQAQELIGAPVYASDGPEVGQVVDVSMSRDNEIDAVRIKVGAFLGFGAYELALSMDEFTALRGAVVIDLPAEVLETLKPVSSEGLAGESE